MKKLVLIDGNNFLFRSYYATLYTGANMKTSDGFPTNALYGFINMINKLKKDLNPEYIAVAFDLGRTFRHDNYEEYKGKRESMPEDLALQFPVAKKILFNMGITCLEKEGYEADDIIGTLAKKVDEEQDFEAVIVSSDKDLLQLISPKVKVRLLKKSDYILVDENNMEELFGIKPLRIIDLKALQGDASDNIPGVKGVGEKTALKLLNQYDTLENIYVNLDEIKGSLHDKLKNNKDDAFMSKSLATIHREVPLDIELKDISIKPETKKLYQMYNDLEFYSFLKNEKKEEEKLEYIKVSGSEVKLTKPAAFFIELDNENYHQAKVTGISIYNDESSYYVDSEFEKIKTDFLKYTYNQKKNIVSFSKINKEIDIDFDLEIAAYLLNYNTKDDIAYLGQNLGCDFILEKDYKKKEPKEIEENIIKKAKLIYDNVERFKDELEKEEALDLFSNIEMPLIKVLADMEITGIKIDKNILDDMGEQIKIKMELLEKDIYNNAGVEFNISSPKQLGEILFDKLNLPFSKKTKTGYSTDRNVLQKLIDKHPIIKLIMEYRILSKLYSTYIEGLKKSITEDGRIHTIYNQTLTRTGRLSSVEPNLQNIPMRYEYGRLIRKCFVADNNSLLLASDYSQIELRILAHMSGVEELIDAFNKEEDIHTKTAMDIFDLPKEMITKDLRRKAKAVNFGIIYGISGYGLSSNLDINVKEAKDFIKRYLESYPGIKKYMDDVVEKAYDEGYVSTLFNRRRKIDELQSKNKMIRNMGERMALNAPIQGTSADIIKKAMIILFEELNKRNLKSKILIQVHDELVLNVIEEEKELIEKLVKETMEKVVELKVPLKVDIETGSNWYEAK